MRSGWLEKLLAAQQSFGFRTAHYPSRRFGAVPLEGVAFGVVLDIKVAEIIPSVLGRVDATLHRYVRLGLAAGGVDPGSAGEAS